MKMDPVRLSDGETASLVGALREASDADAAALIALRQMREVVERVSTEAAGSGALLRLVLHLRPDDAYRSLRVLEKHGTALHDPDPAGAQFLSSATTWRALVERRRAIAIDLVPGTVRLPGAAEPLTAETEALSGAESRQRFLGRDATHVLAIPLRTPARRVVGMIDLEVAGPDDGDGPLFWEHCADALQLVADLAAPYLLAPGARSSPIEPTDPFLPVVGEVISSMLPILRTFARQEESLLISGPTGAGKSRLARWCHEQSSRRGAPFETLDLTSIPEDLQLAEFFGWTRGAFTGAVRDTPGAISRAEGGTLFIDEIDKLSLRAQAALLQVLESRRYRVLGAGTSERRADVRFLIGTNADLATLVQTGAFREDLYFRINVLPVRLPPLRERRDELGEWARFMAERHHRSRGAPGSARVEPAAVERLARCDWPGNLRQLDNIIRRAYALALVQPTGPTGEVELTVAHVEAALAYEPPRERPVVELLWDAARSLVIRGGSAGTGLDLDLADAFRGFVLAAAIQDRGVDSAFRLLGKEALLANRNHHRLLRRERERLEQLHRLLQLPPGPALELLSDPKLD